MSDVNNNAFDEIQSSKATHVVEDTCCIQENPTQNTESFIPAAQAILDEIVKGQKARSEAQKAAYVPAKPFQALPADLPCDYSPEHGQDHNPDTAPVPSWYVRSGRES
jgi:hypothetical protein